MNTPQIAAAEAEAHAINDALTPNGPAVGELVTFAGPTGNPAVPYWGAWRVIWTEAQAVSRNVRLAGWFRAVKVYDGRGPAHLSANFRVTDAVRGDQAAELLAEAARAAEPAEVVELAELPGDAERVAEVEQDAAERAAYRADEAAELAAEAAELAAEAAELAEVEPAELAGTVCLYGPGGPMTADQLTPGDRAAMAEFRAYLRRRREAAGSSTAAVEVEPTEPRTPDEFAAMLGEVEARAEARTVPLPADPVAALDQLGARWSPDFEAYAAGQLDAAAVRCVLCGRAPCGCPPFGSPEYLAMVNRLHGRSR